MGYRSHDHHHHHDCGHDHCGHDHCGHGHHGHRHRHDDRDGELDEKRVIDTIVDLVGERVERLLDDRREHAPPRHDGDEKRIIDLIVGLVSEHVREIVVEELDRRLGRAGAPAAPPARGDEPR